MKFHLLDLWLGTSSFFLCLHALELDRKIRVDPHSRNIHRPQLSSSHALSAPRPPYVRREKLTDLSGESALLNLSKDSEREIRWTPDEHARQIQLKRRCISRDDSTNLFPGRSWKALRKRNHILKRSSRRKYPLWTAGEEQLLIKLRQQKKSWEEISEYFPERTWQAIAGRYYTLTKDPSSPKRRGKSWSREEDKLLFDLAEAEMTWAERAESFPDRTSGAVQARYRYLLKDDIPAPSKVLKKFTKEEDKLLLELGKKDMTWKERAKFFKGRSGDTLKFRFGQLSEDPSRYNWTAEEEEELIEALEEGLGWEEISKLLERSVESVTRRARDLERSGRLKPEDRIKKINRFTVDDLELMHDMREKKMKWKDIAKEHFPGRAPADLCKRYKKYLSEEKEECDET